MRRAGLFVALGLLGLGAECRGLTAQLRMEGSVTGALAWERYGGTFAVLTVPLVDSTEHVFAGASEWDFSGNLSVTRPRRSLNVTADGGLRQLVAGGFLQRNYAPRALNFKVQTRYQELLAAGTLTLGATVDTRSIADLPPMPLYLQPGYLSYSASADFSKAATSSIEVDAGIVVDEKDYAAPSVLRILDFLDRRSFEVRAGSTFRPASVRLYAAYLRHRYRGQGRSDQAFRAGGEWNLSRWGMDLNVDASGTINRSSSSRVEYNALSVEAEATRYMGDYVVTLSGTWSGKSYVSPQEFLVPGEEADNATILFAEVTRFLPAGFEAILGGGWTRAETNISGDYYERFRTSFSLRARF